MIRNDVEMECPCCGDVGATGDEQGLFYDGQPLECGCSGHVSCDGESAAEITIFDGAPCAARAACHEYAS